MGRTTLQKEKKSDKSFVRCILLLNSYIVNGICYRQGQMAFPVYELNIIVVFHQWITCLAVSLCILDYCPV